MLFWPKFLTIAHGVAKSVHVFLPLYFFHLHHLTYLGIAILLAIALTTRTIACGFWIAWVDQRKPMLHGVFTSLLTGLGAASLVLLLSVPPDTWVSWPAAILCMILDGWFFLPLGCLVDSVIIKILGDYKLLYESERRWGKLSLGITALGIGCFLDDDHDFDTLMGTVVIGCAALFLLSLSTNVQPADPLLLGLQIGESSLESSPLLSKPTILPQYYIDSSLPQHRLYVHHHHHHHYHHHHQSLSSSISNQHYNYYPYHETGNTDINSTTPYLDSTNTASSPYYYSNYTTYKPYSLFGGHLSHISEEDDSMLQRIASTPPRASSTLSTKRDSDNQGQDSDPFQFDSPSYFASPPPTPLPNSSFTGHHLSSINHPPTTETPPLSSMTNSIEGVCPNSSSSSSHSIASITSNYAPNAFDTATTRTSSSLNKTFMSMSLALLPLPPGDIPMVILITVFPRFRPVSFQISQRQQKEQHRHLLTEETDDTGYYDNEDDEEPWHLSILASCFILGLLYAPMILFAPLIYHDYFDQPMHTIGWIVLIGCLSDIAVTRWAPSTCERFSIKTCVLLAHLVLMVCLISFAWVATFENQFQSWWLVVSLPVLHFAQSASIRMIWLMASCQVDFLFLPQCQDRMMLRGKMSALYSSIGPALGSLVLGWLVTFGWSIQSIYSMTLLLMPISASLTLGWR